MELYWIVILGCVVVAALIIFFAVSAKKNKWVSTEDFQKAKGKLKRDCTEDEFDAFFGFLKNYKGGFVRRRSGQIVEQGYLGKEKGDLKGIFFNVVYPNHNLSTGKKEEFRRYLVSVGVNGIDERPSYKTRDNRLKNKETDEDRALARLLIDQEEYKKEDVISRMEKPQNYPVYRDRLIRRGILKNRRGYIALTLPYFADYIREYGDAD